MNRCKCGNLERTEPPPCRACRREAQEKTNAQEEAIRRQKLYDRYANWNGNPFHIFEEDE